VVLATGEATAHAQVRPQAVKSNSDKNEDDGKMFNTGTLCI